MFSNRFNTRNDPLLEAVEGAMKDGETRRQAEALVNEEFGVYSRNAVVREHLAAYDARLEEAYKCMKEGGQIDEISKKTAIRAYRERESQHRGEYNQGGSSERSGEKASNTLSRIGNKFGAKTVAQAKHGFEQIDEGGLDPVGREDKDVDNDGDHDKSDKYLLNRRKTIGRAMGKMDEEQIDEISTGLARRYVKKAKDSLEDQMFSYTRGVKDRGIERNNNRKNSVSLAKAKMTGDASYKKYDAWHEPGRMSEPKGRKAKVLTKEEQMDEAAYSAKAGRAGKDLGKPGKSFKKIAAKAGERYGSEERGKRVAGAILKRIRAKHMKEDSPIDESAFGSAFAAARKSGQTQFSYGGKSFNTKMASSSSSAGAPKPTTSLASKPMGNSVSPKPMNNVVSKLPSSGMSAGTAAARTSGSSLPSMASGAAPAPVKPTSKYDAGSTHNVTTLNPSSTGQQATTQSKTTEKGWADPGRWENEAKSKTGSMQQIRGGKLAPPSAELGTPKSMDPVQGGVSSAPTKMPAPSTPTPGSMKISAQPAPMAGPSGADKMKTMASLKESVQIGANKYRIV